MERYKHTTLSLLLGLSSIAMSSTSFAASTVCGGTNKYSATPQPISISTSCDKPNLKQQPAITENDKTFCFDVKRGKIQANRDELLKCQLIPDKNKPLPTPNEQYKHSGQHADFEKAINVIKQLIIIPKVNS